MNHRYLFTLEIVPVEVGKAYDELPSHLTLMARFFSELSPGQLAKIVQPLFDQTTPIELIFGETIELGPKKLTVHMVAYSDGLKQLHNELRTLLDSVNTHYEYPQFIGENHKPHVTKRDEVQFEPSDTLVVNRICLIEIMDSQRVIRAKLKLRNGEPSFFP